MTTTLTFTNGNDTYTVSGTDTFNLDFLAGDDTLTVNGGAFTKAHLRDGNDVVWLLAGDGSIFGEGGNDRFELYASGIGVDGGDGADLFRIRGGSNLALYGGTGDDRFNFYAPTANVLIHGDSGNDIFSGGNQAISGNVYGDAGDDFFFGFGNLNDRVVLLYGGTGNDVFRLYPANPAFFVENAGEGTDTVQVPLGNSYVLPTNFENLDVGNFDGSTNDPAALVGNALDNRITAGANPDSLYGYGGNDKLIGNDGNDVEYGGAGSDGLSGGAGNDVIYGEVGNDIIDGGDGHDSMVGGLGNDLFIVDAMADQITENPGEGVDTVRVGLHLLNEDKYTLPANVENGYLLIPGTSLFDNDLDNLLVGTEAGDALRADIGNDTLMGRGGDDDLKGGNGNNVIDGGDGDDALHVGDGNDVLTGGLGQDYFATGGGADVIIYNQTFDALFDNGGGRPNDQIQDFDVALDKISLIAIDADINSAGKQSFHFTGLTWDHTPGDVWLESDGTVDGFFLFAEVNGDQFADMAIHLILPGGGGSFTADNLIIGP